MYWSKHQLLKLVCYFCNWFRIEYKMYIIHSAQYLMIKDSYSRIIPAAF